MTEAITDTPLDEGAIDRLRNDARAVISGDRISQRAAADDAEIAVGTFNAWIAGTYAGDNVKVAIAVAKWLDARKARNRIKAIVPTPPAFLQTKTVELISSLETAAVKFLTVLGDRQSARTLKGLELAKVANG